MRITSMTMYACVIYLYVHVCVCVCIENDVYSKVEAFNNDPK